MPTSHNHSLAAQALLVVCACCVLCDSHKPVAAFAKLLHFRDHAELTDLLPRDSRQADHHLVAFQPLHSFTDLSAMQNTAFSLCFPTKLSSCVVAQWIAQLTKVHIQSGMLNLQVKSAIQVKCRLNPISLCHKAWHEA
jgi:hypothetical protein